MVRASHISSNQILITATLDRYCSLCVIYENTEAQGVYRQLTEDSKC